MWLGVRGGVLREFNKGKMEDKGYSGSSYEDSIFGMLLGNIVLNVCSLLEELGSQKEFLLVNVCLFSYMIMNMFSLK